jgi:uncharacterized membrane protein
MKNLKTLTMLSTLLALMACHYKIDKQGAEPSPQNGEQAVEAIDFAFVKSEVFQPRCLECHAAGGSAEFIPLVTYNDVKANLSDIKADIADDSMPKNRAPLTARQKQIVNSWIDAGAPEVAVQKPEAPTLPPTDPGAEPTPTPEPTPQPTPQPTPEQPMPAALDWLSVKTLVIDQACLGCHSAPKNRGDVNLETHQNTLSSLTLVDEQIRGGTMPIGKNPATGEKNKLTDEQKKLILDWIQAGAPEFAKP